MSNPSSKVALFSTSFLPYSQTFIYEEIQAHQRYSVDVFCKERKNEKRFPYDRYFKPKGEVRELLYENIAYWPSFNRQIKNGSYDIIHAHFGTGAVYALPYALRNDIPFVVTFHGYDVATLIGVRKYQPSNWRYVLYSRKILAAADLILAVSNEMAEILRELSGRPEIVKTYRIGVNLATFEPVNYEQRSKNEECHIIMIGRFAEKKGHIYALKALDLVQEKGFQVHLHFVGEGDLKQRCVNFVQDNNLGNNVSFHGILDSEEIADLLKKMDFIIAPSIVAKDQDREGGPVVIKEANSTAIPAIGTYHGGIPEIIDDGKTGYLVPERDYTSLADRMIKLIENPDKRKAFGIAARKKMEEEYDIQKQVQQLEVYYDQLVHSK